MDGDGGARAGETVEVRVDEMRVRVRAGASLLEACDRAGVYVPRLCAYPGLTDRIRSGSAGRECGLCLVRMGDGSVVLSCATAAERGIEITTCDGELRGLRLGRLAAVLAGHPHVCLTCPDRDGCARDTCLYGIDVAARCCGEFGRCELGKVAAFVDPDFENRSGAVAVSREAEIEGRIRREPGLCIACGRCVAACAILPEAGEALEMGPAARPKRGNLRGSGCTFCGGCIAVCPAGALTAPGEKGARWLSGRLQASHLQPQVLPSHVSGLPAAREAVGSVPAAPGVFTLIDSDGEVLCIVGTADLRQGLARALEDPAYESAAFFRTEFDDLYTQRESELLARYARARGRLPSGNEPGDDLFGVEPGPDDALGEGSPADEESTDHHGLR